ncbi:hypothetical protein ACS5PK_22555 [Roseateles sp. DB2]|uniref:hypothetical protein n=1 Tax=Roseateles sp. DB2 TaxID=3453717 RepID=UPI003EEF10AF
MRTDNLVNGYVLSNLFYELMFLGENGIQATDADWNKPEFVERVIRNLVVPRYESLKDETKQVVKNTLGYLIAVEPEGSELLDIIWQSCSAPVPTPNGIRAFMLNCYGVIFPNSSLPTSGDVQALIVNHNTQMANRLN